MMSTCSNDLRLRTGKGVLSAVCDRGSVEIVGSTKSWRWPHAKPIMDDLLGRDDMHCHREEQYSLTPGRYVQGFAI